jgi:signal peptidase I
MTVKERTVRFIRSWGPVIIIVLFIRAFIIEAFRIPSGSMEDTLLNGDMLLVNKFIYGIKLPFTTNDIVKIRSPKPGDIIVFRYPADPDWPEPEANYVRFFPKWCPLLPLYWDKTRHRFNWYSPRNFIKRCVALEGDTVEMRNKDLYVNGKRKYEPYVVHKDPHTYDGFTLSQKEYQTLWEKRVFLDNPEIGGTIRDNFGPVVVPKGCVMAMGDNRDNSSDARFWGPLDKKYIKGQALIIYFYIGPGGIKWDRIGRLIR